MKTINDIKERLIKTDKDLFLILASVAPNAPGDLKAICEHKYDCHLTEVNHNTYKITGIGSNKQNLINDLNFLHYRSKPINDGLLIKIDHQMGDQSYDWRGKWSSEHKNAPDSNPKPITARAKQLKRIIIETRDNDDNLIKILEDIKGRGNVGHSFEIKIEEATYSWDGDGSDYIKSIKVEEAEETKATLDTDIFKTPHFYRFDNYGSDQNKTVFYTTQNEKGESGIYHVDYLTKEIPGDDLFPGFKVGFRYMRLRCMMQPFKDNVENGTYRPVTKEDVKEYYEIP